MSKERIKKFENITERPLLLLFSPDGKHLIFGSNYGEIDIWDIDSGKCLNNLILETDMISLLCNQDGRHLISGHEDGKIIIWDFYNGSRLLTLDSKSNVAINQNGYFNASDESIDKYLRVSESPLNQIKLTPE